MENDADQGQNTNQKLRVKAFKPSSTKGEPSSTLPLMITLIGIFCYLGVVLPSVFESSTRFLNYSTFDILLMVGGASLVALGAYFWFKAKAKVFIRKKDRTIELA